MGARFWLRGVRKLAIDMACNFAAVSFVVTVMWLFVRFLSWTWVLPTWALLRFVISASVAFTIYDLIKLGKGR